MDILHTIILSIIEGITEFLPVSSTGHVLLFSDLLKIPDSDFLTSFTIAIQLGAMLSVVAIYFKKLTSSFEIWKKIIVGFIPTAVVGFLFYNLIKGLLQSEIVIIIAIFVGGLIMIGVERWLARTTSAPRTSPSLKGGEEVVNKDRDPHVPHLAKDMLSKREGDARAPLTYTKSFYIGLFQVIAFIPGVSRSAATIIGGLLLGVSRKQVVEFSFLLALPTMAAATGFDLLQTGFSFSSQQWLMLEIGFVISFAVALAVIKWLLRYIEKYTFIPFGIYRIVVSVVLGLVLFL